MDIIFIATMSSIYIAAHLEDSSCAKLAAVHEPQKLASHDGHLVATGGVEHKHRTHRLHERQRWRA